MVAEGDAYKPVLPGKGTLSREDVVRGLTTGGGYVQLDQMPDAMKAQLKQAGVTDKDLQAIAGTDGAIRGREDFGRLFAALDKGDRNGSKDSVALTNKQGQATAQGQALKSLDEQIAANRNRAASEGGTRFVDDKRLEATLKGGAALKPGESGAHVEKVQQALADLGLGNAQTMEKGRYDAATIEGVKRFQREAGLAQDGVVGKDTLGALTATAPKAGEVSKASADYDRLFKDGRLDVGIGVGFDEQGNHTAVETSTRAGLLKQGFKETAIADIEEMAPADRERLGLTDARLDKNAAYFLKDDGAGNNDDAVARMITPKAGATGARDGYAQMLKQDELVVYAGHARYGTGPDFDAKSSGAGNFVIDGHGNRRGDALPAELRCAIPDTKRCDLPQVSERPDYQVLGFNGCTTEDYVTRLRSSAPGGRDAKSTDIYTTSMVGRFPHLGPSVDNLVKGTMERQTNRQIMEAQNKLFVDMLKQWKLPGKEGDPREGALLITGSGFLDAKHR